MPACDEEERGKDSSHKELASHFNTGCCALFFSLLDREVLKLELHGFLRISPQRQQDEQLGGRNEK